MRRSPFQLRARCACLAALAGGLMLLAGCADGTFDRLHRFNPFHRKDSALIERYGPLPTARIDELRAAAEAADKYTLEERRQWTQHLAERLANESDPAIRKEIVYALGAMGTEEAAGPLRTALADSDKDVRAAACRAWARRGDGEGLRALAETLASDQDLDVRIAAARGLGHFRDPAAVRALAVALDDADPALQYRGVQSLKSASGRDFGDDLAAWRAFAQGNEPAPGKSSSPSLVDRVRKLF